MIRILLIIVFLAGTAGAVVAYGDPDKIARAGDSISHMIRQKSLTPPPPVQIPRGQGGEFSLKAKINGVSAPMVIDTGATSVVLTMGTDVSFACNRCGDAPRIQWGGFSGGRTAPSQHPLHHC